VLLGDCPSPKYRLQALFLDEVNNLVAFIPPVDSSLGLRSTLQHVVPIKVCYDNNF